MPLFSCRFCLFFFGASSLPPVPLSQSEGCGSVSKAKYSGRYTMRDRGRQLHIESGRGKMDCSELNNNGRVRAWQSPTGPEHYHRGLMGSCCIPQERAQTCTHNAALLILRACVCVCVYRCIESIKRQALKIDRCRWTIIPGCRGREREKMEGRWAGLQFSYNLSPWHI